jgi:hypothetical protein
MKRIKSFKFEVSSFQWERWLGVAEFEMAAVIDFYGFLRIFTVFYIKKNKTNKNNHMNQDIKKMQAGVRRFSHVATAFWRNSS